MKVSQTFSLLALMLAISACNEKISPELQNGSASTNTTVGPGGITLTNPNEYYFSVTDASNPILGYRVHKTGAGNYGSACEVRNTTGLTNDNFRGAPSVNDISCFFEAEELSMFHQGIKFSVNTSQNTCDFIAYTPFSYFEATPGDSSGTYTEVKCMTDLATSADAQAEAPGQGINLSYNGGTIGCNGWLSNDLSPAVRLPATVTSDQDLCRFNHSYNDGTSLNCDIGTITIKSLQVYATKDANGVRDVTSQVVPRTVKCGGKIPNCVAGPIEFIKSGVTRWTLFDQPTPNAAFSKTYELPQLMGKHTSNRRYANFRRDLASLELDYGTSDGLTSSYKSYFADPIIGKAFTPTIMDFYSDNKKLDGTELISPALITTYSNQDNMYYATPFAAEPFLGLKGYKVNPFYTFYCFDANMDIKARIRMVVRDWDRIFSTTASDVEYISDIWKGANSKMDNPGYVELPDDNDGYIPFNDLGDWDDFISMQRTSGAFNSPTTIWQPYPSLISYPDGFFNPDLFTNRRDVVPQN